MIERDTNKAKPRPRHAKYLDTRSGRIRLAMIADNSAASIEAFVNANVKRGATLLSLDRLGLLENSFSSLSMSGSWPASRIASRRSVKAISMASRVEARTSNPTIVRQAPLGGRAASRAAQARA